MAERFAIGGQAAGFISFRYPIEDASTYSGAAVHMLSIPEGMLCIGGNGRGYVLESRETGSSEGLYIFTPTLTEGDYLLFATDPVDGTGTGDGIAIIDHMEYNTYINGAGHASPTKWYHGDTNARRAFCFFKVIMDGSTAKIQSSSITTFTSFNYNEQYDYLKKIGFFLNKTDSEFAYRGNYWDESVRYTDATTSWTAGESNPRAVADWDVVYKKEEYSNWAASTAYSVDDIITEVDWDWIVTAIVGTGTSDAAEPDWNTTAPDIGDTLVDNPGANQITWQRYRKSMGMYDQAIADDTVKESYVGVAEVNRNGVVNDNFVVTSGILDVGTTYLPNKHFPVGTYLYLTDKADHITVQRDDNLPMGNIVKDFDDWEENHVYTVGERIRPLLDNTTTPYTFSTYVYECTSASGTGTSGIEANKPTFPTTLGLTVIDNAGTNQVVWTCKTVYNQQQYQSSRNICLGVSLGHGIIFLQSGFSGSLIDDHNESAIAHSDIQTAMNKAGIYVVNANQGEPVIDVTFQGQHFDEQATFSSGADYNIVYKTTTNHQYGPAQAGQAGNIDNPIGIRLPGGKVASGIGFVDYDTTATGPSGAVAGAFTSGDKLYLSSTNAGQLTNIKTDITPFVGYCIQGNTDLSPDTAASEARGCILLFLSVTDEDVTSSMLIDEVATLAGGAIATDIVYKTTAAAHEYGPAQAGQAGQADNPVGIALSTTSIALGSGLVQYDTSSAGPSGTLTDGAKLYLSSATSGLITAVKSDITPFIGHCIKGSSTIANGGLIFLDFSVTDEDVASSMLIDEIATLTGGAIATDIVYKTTATAHEYGPAQAGGAGNIDNPVGIALSTTSIALGSGRVQYDTTAAGPSGLLAHGDKLYLSSATAGLITNIKTDITPFIGHCIEGNATIVNGGEIFLVCSDTDEDVASSMLIDEVAVISGGAGAAVYDLVYKTTTATSHEYGPALAGGAGNIDNPVGLALSTTSIALGNGLVQYDTTTSGHSGLLTDGAKLYLSSASAGKFTTTKTDITPFVGHCIKGNATIANGGLVFLSLSVTDEDVASSMSIDEIATLSGASVGDVVYKTAVDHQYGQAKGGGAGNIDNAIGIALSTTSIALGSGLVQYDTSGFTAGDKLYLSSSVAGTITSTKGASTPFLGYCVDAATVVNGGMIYLMISGADEDSTGGSSVNEGDFFVNDDIFAGIKSIVYEDKAVSTSGVITDEAHGLSNGQYIYLTNIDTSVEYSRTIYQVSSAAANTFKLTVIGGSEISTATAGFISWVGPQSDALIDGNGFFVPGTSMHSMTYSDTLDAWEFTNGLVVVNANGDGIIRLPAGTTLQAPAPAAGNIGGMRWNTDTVTLDTSNGSSWEAQATEGFATAIAIALG